MLQTRRAIRAAAAATSVLAAAACTSFADAHGPTASSSSAAASSSAAIAAAATAKPGTYGTPVNPSLPNPPSVATDPPVAPAPAGTAVTVSISYSGWNAASSEADVGAYVQGIVESGGTCTLTLTKAGRSVVATTTATPSASSTSCGRMAVAGSKLSAGSWSAVASYRSPQHAGTSAPIEVTVP